MEKEIIIKATLIIEAIDQEGNSVDVKVNKVTVNEVVFDKIIVTQILTEMK